MPTVFTINGYRFFFFSNENREPLHVHIEKAEKHAKYWLEPVALAENYLFNSTELSKIEIIIQKHLLKIKEDWHGYFNA